MAIGLLILRLVVGLTLAAHGAQKLFGWFGGYGLNGTGGFLEQLGFVPGRRNALLAGLSETAGGLLLALGLATPAAGREAEVLESSARAREPGPAEPAKQLLRAVRGQRQADHQPQDQETNRHNIHRFLLEWYYLLDSNVAITLSIVKWLSFGKELA